MVRAPFPTPLRLYKETLAGLRCWTTKEKEGNESRVACVCVYLLRNKCAYCARQRATLHSIPYTRINGSRQLFYVFFFCFKNRRKQKNKQTLAEEAEDQESFTSCNENVEWKMKNWNKNVDSAMIVCWGEPYTLTFYPASTILGYRAGRTNGTGTFLLH